MARKILATTFTVDELRVLDRLFQLAHTTSSMKDTRVLVCSPAGRNVHGKILRMRAKADRGESRDPEEP